MIKNSDIYQNSGKQEWRLELIE